MRGQGAELPCGVWGNAPTVGRVTISKESANKGAGSEASLPVTLRSRRSAPKLLFPTSMLCRARWARPDCLSSRHSLSFSQAGVSRLRARQEGFLGTFYERETPSEKTVILVGGSGEGRAVKVLQPCARKIGMSGLSLVAACTLLCADGKSPEATKRLLAKMMTMEAKYPEECSRARADSWAKLVDFFQTW